MELRDVYELWERFDASDAVAFELGMQGDYLKLRRDGEKSVHQRETHPYEFEHPADKTDRMQTVQNLSDIKKEETGKDVQADISQTPVKAPLVGTFYLAPSPEDAPFVEVGKQVKKGDVVGIIEAMKLMNEVLAPVDGTILSIEAGNGTMVEFDQVLVTIG